MEVSSRASLLHLLHFIPIVIIINNNKNPWTFDVSEMVSWWPNGYICCLTPFSWMPDIHNEYMENHVLHQHIAEYRNITEYHKIIKYQFLKDLWVHHINEYIS